MRVTIHIDDQEVTVPTADPAEHSVAPASSATPSQTVEPLADLLARAAALDAISAGPAPNQHPGGADPGTPGITVKPAGTGTATNAQSDAIAAGAAPGQLDVVQAIEPTAESM